MKVYADALGRQLDSGLKPVYLVSGDEPLLCQEASDLIRAAARAAGCTEREVHHAEGSFDWHQVLASGASMSLFAERKLIELRIPSGKPGDAGARALVEYVASAGTDNVLLINLPKLDGNQQRSKWFKALDKIGAYVQIWPVEAKRLPGWVAQRLQAAGVHADGDAIRLLAERAEGNLLAAVQEIEKLKLLTEDGHITPDLINQVVADSARYDVFTLVDRALHGDSRQAMKTLMGLKGEGTEVIIILWALSREIRTLLQIKEALDTGQAMDWALKNARVWDKRKADVQQALRRLSRHDLEDLLNQAWQLDQAAKGLRPQTALWDELSQFVLRLCGTPLPLWRPQT